MKIKILTIIVSVLFYLMSFSGLSAAEAKPFTLYSNPSGKPVQFRDAEGHVLYFGNYGGHKLVSSPAGTVSVTVSGDAALTEVTNSVSLTPDFWIEESKVISNAGTDVEVAPYGYAVSICIPITYDFVHRYGDNAKDLPRDSYYWSTPRRIWYDKDMNYLRVDGKRPENAFYYRILCPYGPANHHMALKPNALSLPEIAGVLPLHPGEIVLSPKADLRERYAAT